MVHVCDIAALAEVSDAECPPVSKL
jgi:hypothetical protein